MVLLLGAAFLAPACSIEYAGFAAMALGAGILARGIPRYLPWAFLAPQAASGLAVLAAFTAGYSLRAGDEAITLLPGGLLVLAVLAGVPRGSPPRLRPAPAPASRSSRRAGLAAVPLACVAVPALVLPAPVPSAAILLAAVFAAAAFALAQVLPLRLAAAAALIGGCGRSRRASRHARASRRLAGEGARLAGLVPAPLGSRGGGGGPRSRRRRRGRGRSAGPVLGGGPSPTRPRAVQAGRLRGSDRRR